MKKTLWFLTRSFPPMRGGGAQIRKMQVDTLQREYDVQVIASAYRSFSSNQNGNIIYFPKLIPYRLSNRFEALGLCNSMTDWLVQTTSFLKKNVKDNDVVFATTGGETGCFHLGYLIKQHNPSVKLILNYHDLLDYGEYDNSRIFTDWHVRIDEREKAYIEAADAVIGCNQTMQEMLEAKFSKQKHKLHVVYFGCESNDSPTLKMQPKCYDTIKICCVGQMGPLQSPEVLLQAWRQLSGPVRQKLQITYIGEYEFNSVIKSDSSVEKIAYIPRDKLVELMTERFDLGFLSLIDKPGFRPFLPTKFYEYLGCGLPVIGAGPEHCEVAELLERYDVGAMVPFNNSAALVELLDRIGKNPGEHLPRWKENIPGLQKKLNSTQTLAKMLDILKELTTSEFVNAV